MCGRFTLSSDLTEFAKQLGLRFDSQKYKPRYNICPSQQVAAVLNDDSNELMLAKWGLVPAWARDPSIGNRLVNARAEGIETKASFRNSFKRRRCVVLADGFFEWGTRPGQKGKIPYYFRLTSREVFGLAALWDIWLDPSAKTELLTICLITTTPNRVVEPIHNRMPVIVEPRFFNIWLSEEEQPLERLKRCLEPYPAAGMESYAVSKIVNSPGNDRAECIRPSGETVCG